MKSKTIKWDGHQITKPGAYSGVSLAIYHAPNICVGPSISSSGLRKINPDVGSPAHFYAKWNGNPDAADEEDKRHFIVGRALHHLVLGEPFFAKLFCIQPDEWPDEHGVLKPWHNNRTVCKKWHAEKQKEGRAALTPNEVDQIRHMATSVGNHPLVKGGILNGQIERSFFWKDKETGIWLKWRPDAVPTDSLDFGELKTTDSILYPSLSSTIRKFAYYQQAALGRVACRELLDMDMGEYTYIFVEKQPPWITADFRLEDEDIHRGMRMNCACLRTFARCLKDKRWPGPYDGDEGNRKLVLSATAREDIDRKLKYEGLADGED